LRQRRWAEAASATRKALQINGSDWSAWANLGQAYDWMNRTNEAQEAYRNEWARLAELAKIRGDEPELQAELGLLYSKWRQQEKALPLLDAALTRAPNDPNILVIIAEAYENLGNRSRALQLIQQALAHGASLDDLLHDHGQQSLIRDSRFREITNQLKNNSNPAQQKR
jgi:Flp pilus assembly protein TadD